MKITYQLPILGQGRPSYSVKDIRQLQRNLREIEPELRRQFVRDIKSIGKEPQKAISSALRQVTPLSGMRFHYGRTAWGKGARPDSTSLQFRTQAGGKSLTTTLLRIKLNSAAASMADMAGRSSRSVGRGYQGSGMTREFVKRNRAGELITVRRRTPASAGQKFIQNLNGMGGVVKRAASRIAWPSVDKNLPRISKEIDAVVRKYYKMANRKFS